MSAAPSSGTRPAIAPHSATVRQRPTRSSWRHVSNCDSLSRKGNAASTPTSIGPAPIVIAKPVSTMSPVSCAMADRAPPSMAMWRARRWYGTSLER